MASTRTPFSRIQRCPVIAENVSVSGELVALAWDRGQRQWPKRTAPTPQLVLRHAEPLIAYKVACFTTSVRPKPLESLGAEFRIAHGMRDVPVPEILLDGARVVTVVGELEPGRMAQHVRMNWERQLRSLAGARK